MNAYPPESQYDTGLPFADQPILAELVAEPMVLRLPRRPSSIRRWLPIILFVATCFTTFFAGTHIAEVFVAAMERAMANEPAASQPGSPVAVHIDLEGILPSLLRNGLIYSACVMTILLCHEMGHYFQARRYRVPASLPWFIPMPFGPVGTMGAVIGMRPGFGDRKAIFDIGITGPLAGLVPTMIFAVAGLQFSHVENVPPNALQYGDPLLLRALYSMKFGPIADGQDVTMNPMLFAAWVGLLITSINLIPIGQLDGGHVLYALLRKKAHHVASWLLTAAVVAVVAAAVVYHYPTWILMLLLLLAMGPRHPPTANDNVPLGPLRVVLGWLTLAFVLVGFTPMPVKL